MAANAGAADGNNAFTHARDALAMLTPDEVQRLLHERHGVQGPPGAAPGAFQAGAQAHGAPPPMPMPPHGYPQAPVFPAPPPAGPQGPWTMPPPQWGAPHAGGPAWNHPPQWQPNQWGPPAPGFGQPPLHRHRNDMPDASALIDQLYVHNDPAQTFNVLNHTLGTRESAAAFFTALVHKMPASPVPLVQVQDALDPARYSSIFVDPKSASFVIPQVTARIRDHIGETAKSGTPSSIVLAVQHILQAGAESGTFLAHPGAIAGLRLLITELHIDAEAKKGIDPQSLKDMRAAAQAGEVPDYIEGIHKSAIDKKKLRNGEATDKPRKSDQPKGDKSGSV